MTDLARRHSQAFLVAAVVIAAAWAILSPDMGSVMTVFVLGSLTLALGLPHGALDLWIAARQERWGGGGRFSHAGILRFHLEYVLLALLTVAAFWLAPVAALLAFLALSLYHFADDWRGLPLPLRLGCASVIVLAPALFHPVPVAEIFAAMTGAMETTAFVPIARPVFGGVLGTVTAAALVYDRRAGAEVVALTGLALVLPPLPFFATYFVLLHGPRHMLRHAGAVRGRGGPLLILGYAAAAMTLILVMGLVLGRQADLDLADGTLRAVFIGLAALTVPHALLIDMDARRPGMAAQHGGLEARDLVANPRA